MAVADDLQTAYSQLVAAYLAATLDPKPSYSVGGQSVQWGEYLRTLAEQIKATQELIAAADVYEIRTQVI